MAGEPNLNPGESSEWVHYLQRCLNTMHGYSLEESGSFDDFTAEAVLQVQRSAGLTADGSVGPRTWAAILGEHASDDGNRPEAAAQAQEARVGIATVRFWAKAFIPSNAPGAFQATGASSGHWVINGPLPHVSDCFWTDNRGFSSNPHASARMNVEFTVDTHSGSIASQFMWCDETHECDCEDGDIEGTATGTMKGGIGGVTRAGNILSVHYTAAANNPLWTGSPDIDMNGTVSINLDTNTVTVDGLIDGFPAFEAYCSINGGAAETLYREGPVGDSPASLVGAASNPASGSATL